MAGNSICRVPEIPVRHSCGHVQPRCYVNHAYWREHGLCTACTDAYLNRPIPDAALDRLDSVLAWVNGEPRVLNDDGSLREPKTLTAEQELWRKTLAEAAEARAKKKARPKKKAAPRTVTTTNKRTASGFH